MRYGIVSDVHANWQAWEAVRVDMARHEVETVVCLGDVVGYGPRPEEVLTAIRDVTTNFVLGNHDAAACGRLDAAIFNERARVLIEWTKARLSPESLDFLRALPLQMDGPGLQFLHAEVLEPGEFGYVTEPVGAGMNLRAMTQPLAFIGHTHIPRAFAMDDGGGEAAELPANDFVVEEGHRYLVNVGSVGEPRTTDVRASYVIHDDRNRTVIFRRVPFDVDGYKADLRKEGLEFTPYFVQQVDAGMQDEFLDAKPQLALASRPTAPEVLSGQQGQVVLASDAAYPAGETAPASSNRPLLTPAQYLLGLMLLAIVAALLTLGREDKSEGSGQSAAEKGKQAADGGQDAARASQTAEAVPDATSRPEAAAEKPGRLSEGLIGYWSFDENRSTAPQGERDLAVDQGSVRGTLERRPGRFGEAFFFDGTSSVEIGRKDEFAIGKDSHSIHLWFTRVHQAGDSSARRLVSAGAGSKAKPGWALWMGKDESHLTFAISDGGGRADVQTHKSSLGDGQWHHVLVVTDRQAGRVRVYLDGQLTERQTGMVDAVKELTSGTGLSIGRNSDDQQHHHGLLDDLALWKRALDEEEVALLYQSGKPLRNLIE